MKKQININSEQIEIKAPMYRGILLALIDTAIFYIPLTSIGILVIGIFYRLIDKYSYTITELLMLILVSAITIYLILIVLYFLLQLYYLMSKQKVIINAQEVALYSRDRKKKTIKKDEIDKIIHMNYLPLCLMYDRCEIYSKSKTVIHFYVSNKVLAEIYRLTDYKIE
ncbi:MAG: hypothetical protein J1F36_05830 [Clostridiales bacterium]|nr:hypothetical protein [Clostridiales bacterium]